MNDNASVGMRYRKWWLGGERADVHVFLAEEFGETHKGLRIMMWIGAVLFFLRGVLDIWTNPGPDWEREFMFRAGGGVLFALMAYSYVKSAPRPLLFCAYIFLYIALTAIWVPQQNLHVGYLAVPIMLCAAFGVLMWPKIDGLHWPALSVIVPALSMLIYVQASSADWAAYLFYFMVSIAFAIAIRRTRLRTAFALFVFRENLRNKADGDPLTGLLNRAGWSDQAGGLCSAAQASGIPATIIFFDVDHFKKVNDEHGHAAGDRVLISVAEMLDKGLRPGDVLARLGGEEFVAAMLGVGAEEGMEMANRMRKSIKDFRGPIPVTISAGVAEISNGIGLSQAMNLADMGLLEAKRHGRNQVCMARAPDEALIAAQPASG